MGSRQYQGTAAYEADRSMRWLKAIHRIDPNGPIRSAEPVRRLFQELADTKAWQDPVAEVGELKAREVLRQRLAATTSLHRTLSKR